MEEPQDGLEEIISRRLITRAESGNEEAMKQTDDGRPTFEREGEIAIENAAPQNAVATSEESEPKLPGTTFTKVEKSLASLGYFTPSSRRIKDQRIKRISFTRQIDGKRVEGTAEILPTMYGLPVTADQDKYLALQKIVTDTLQSEGKISNPVRFTSAQLLRLLNNRVRTGKNYKVRTTEV